MAANFSNKIIGMYQSAFAKALIHSGKKIVMDENGLNALVKTKTANISYEEGD